MSTNSGSSVAGVKFIDIVEKILNETFDIRHGEGRRALMMWIYIFLIISSLLIVKPVVISMFLTRFGVEQLPFVFILVAVFAAGISSLYSELLKKAPVHRLIVKTLKISIAFLFMFWSFLQLNLLPGWIIYIFYVFVAIFAVISSSQFWILANVIFNAREAKRLFGFIGSGAIAGGIFGGYLTNFLAPVISSENLIFICIGFLLLCIPITNNLWKDYFRNAEHRKLYRAHPVSVTAVHPVRIIRQSKHLIYLASIVGTGVLVAKLIEYQFGAIAAREITNEDQLTAFFGFWLSNLNIASLLIQLFVTRRVVGVFGVGTSLLFLPVGILIGAVTIFITPVLWAGVFIKITDGSLKNSINKAGIELLALPIPVEIKNQAKSFIDVFVDSFATGIGGLLLIFLTYGFDFSIRQISLIIILLLSLWIYLVTRIRKEYVNSFRLKIESNKINSNSDLPDIQNESVFGGFIKILEGKNESQILQVLKMVKPIQNDRLLPCFQKLLNHSSGEIKLEVLRNIYFYKHVDLSAEVENLIQDPDLEIKTEAIHYLFQRAGGQRIEKLSSFLQSPDITVRSAALLCAARESRNNPELKQQFRVKESVNELMKDLRLQTNKSHTKSLKTLASRVIDAADIPELYPYLHILLSDSDPDVLKAAILAAGSSKNMDFIPVLIRMQKKKRLWKYTYEALLAFGPEILDVLNEHLNNPYVERNIRLSIPALIANFRNQKAVDVLVKNLQLKDALVRYEVINALYDLRLNSPALNFHVPNLANRIFAEANDYVNTLAFLYSQVRAETISGAGNLSDPNQTKLHEARNMLIKALEDRLDNNLERIFRLLGLKYPPEDIENVYSGISSSKPDVRVNAVEFLDNVLESDLKKIIIPIVETTMISSVIDKTLEQFGLKIKSEHECLTTLLSSEDTTLQIRTLYLVSQLKDEKYLPFIGSLVNSPDPKVRKMAGFALKHIGVDR